MSNSEVTQSPVYSVKSPEFWVILILMMVGFTEMLSWNVHMNLQGWKNYALVGVMAGGCHALADATVRCISMPIRRLLQKRSTL